MSLVTYIAVAALVNFPTPKGGGFQANKEIRWGWFTQPLLRKIFSWLCLSTSFSFKV